MSDFYKVHKFDECWKSKDAKHELEMMDKRKDDFYPQGREECKKFLEKAAKKGFQFNVWAQKTKPKWTWYFEVEPAEYLKAKKLGEFAKPMKYDESWDCKPSDVDKECGLVDKRTQDFYPQGRDDCKKFMKVCGKKGYNFRVWAKKTSPKWTWYYEVIA